MSNAEVGRQRDRAVDSLDASTASFPNRLRHRFDTAFGATKIGVDTTHLLRCVTRHDFHEVVLVTARRTRRDEHGFRVRGKSRCEGALPGGEARRQRRTRQADTLIRLCGFDAAFRQAARTFDEEEP